MDRSIDPEPSQPRMFGGSIGSAELSWEWATERLSRARTYWIATTRPAGQPHSRPLWGVWLDTTFYFSTGSLAAQNLAARPAITVHLDSRPYGKGGYVLCTSWRAFILQPILPLHDFVYKCQALRTGG
jgi:hypothetical protein